MKNKIKEKITMEIGDETIELSKMEARAVKHAQKRNEKAKAKAVMSEEEIKALKTKRLVKAGGIAAGAVAVVGGLAMVLSKNKSVEEDDTITYTDLTSDETDDLVAMEEATDEETTEE